VVTEFTKEKEMFKLIAEVTNEVEVKFRGRTFKKLESRYTYEDDAGAKLTFEAHPSKAWSWVAIKKESNEKGLALQKAIINFHVDNISIKNI
jgi:hypothetical protein